MDTSMIIIIAGAVFLIGGIIMLILTLARQKQNRLPLVICSIVIMSLSLIVIGYGMIGIFVSGLSSSLSATLEENERRMNFSPAEGSKPIAGTLSIEDHDITFPCIVSDLMNQGYYTDYEYFNEEINLWPLGETDIYTGRYLKACIDDSYGYNSHDHIKGSDQVSAVKIKDESGLDFDFNGIEFGMFKEDFIARFGIPALEIDNIVAGDSLYYLGENDVIYRFNFGTEISSLNSIMVGTSDYMKHEMQGLYHT